MLVYMGLAVRAERVEDNGHDKHRITGIILWKTGLDEYAWYAELAHLLFLFPYISDYLL